MEKLFTILKGMWIGATMTVPGVSGGTMAVLIGIYESLLDAVNGLWKQPKKYIPFLLQFAVGGGVGFLLFAKGITFLLDNSMTGDVIRLLFCGIVAGGVPLLVKKSGVNKISFRGIFCLLFGVVMVLLLSMIPQGTFGGGAGIKNILLMFLGGFLIAIALILPGISASHMLYILGLYERVLNCIYGFDILALLPLMAGGVSGVFLTTGILEKLLKKYPAEVYLTIIGFVAGSMVTLFPQGTIEQPLIGIVMLVLGFIAMYMLGKKINCME